MTNSTAQQIQTRVAGATAITFESGYAVFADGSRALFEPAQVIRKRVNLAGRCTALDCRYNDGSRLFFRYHAERGISIGVSA